MRVMVVDDSTITIKKITTMLAEMGHAVVRTARSGTEAIEVYAGCAPDLVTMDITMPELDGIEATRAILERHPQALIVVVTSHGQEQMVLDALDAGAKGYILKPIKKEKFQQTIERVAKKYL